MASKILQTWIKQIGLYEVRFTLKELTEKDESTHYAAYAVFPRRMFYGGESSRFNSLLLPTKSWDRRHADGWEYGISTLADNYRDFDVNPDTVAFEIERLAWQLLDAQDYVEMFHSLTQDLLETLSSSFQEITRRKEVERQ